MNNVASKSAHADCNAQQETETWRRKVPVCHWLPCNIDYDGMAPVHVYFKPQGILESDNGDNSGTPLQAVQFRGRSLLSTMTTSTPLKGAVLGEKAQVVGTFESVQEWHHVDTVQQARNVPSATQTAINWIEIASALHGEVPLNKENMQ